MNRKDFFDHISFTSNIDTNKVCDSSKSDFSFSLTLISRLQNSLTPSCYFLSDQTIDMPIGKLQFENLSSWIRVQMISSEPIFGSCDFLQKWNCPFQTCITGNIRIVPRPKRKRRPSSIPLKLCLLFGWYRRKMAESRKIEVVLVWKARTYSQPKTLQYKVPPFGFLDKSSFVCRRAFLSFFIQSFENRSFGLFPHNDFPSEIWAGNEAMKRCRDHVG